MRGPALRRAPLPSPVLAALCGAVLGVLTFVVAGWLFSAGAPKLAELTAEAALLAALACLAAYAVLDRPARLRRARVPIDRALPPAWWPRDGEPVTVLAACAGAPLLIGAGAAFLLFR